MRHSTWCSCSRFIGCSHCRCLRVRDYRVRIADRIELKLGLSLYSLAGSSCTRRGGVLGDESSGGRMNAEDCEVSCPAGRFICKREELQRPVACASCPLLCSSGDEQPHGPSPTSPQTCTQDHGEYTQERRGERRWRVVVIQSAAALGRDVAQNEIQNSSACRSGMCQGKSSMSLCMLAF